MRKKIKSSSSEGKEKKKGVTQQGIKSDMQKLIKSFTPVKHTKMLNVLLNEIKRIDFREKADLKGETTKLSKKHYLICCVEEILNIAKQNNWGICKNNDFIYLYNGAYWNLVDTNELQIFLGDAAEKMGIDKFDAKYYSFQEHLYKQFLTLSHLPKPEDVNDNVFINLANGTFEISANKQELRAPKREDFIKYQLPFKFDEKAVAPIFQNFLDRVLPEKEKQLILAEFFGYLFIKPSVLKLEKTLLLYGKGSNGKSVIFDIIIALLGGQANVSNYSLNSLTDEKGYHRANLANKLLNYSSEISGNLEASIFKQLVSGEPVEARLPYHEPFILKDYAKFVFNCNELPQVTEHTHAFFRRFLILNFDITIPEEEQDRELSKKIIENELSAVFNWVLDGLKRLLENKKFTYCESVENQIKLYKKHSDTVQLFLEDEHYIQGVDEIKALKEVYQEYRSYCVENGYKTCSNKTFSERLKNIDFIIERKSYGMAICIKKNNV